MKKLLRILGIIVVLAGVFLVILKTTTRFSSTPTATLANPASVYCEQQSGTLEIVTDASGAQSGICHLTGGVDCEEWAYFRGECPTEITGSMQTVDSPIITGGKKVVISDVGMYFYIPNERTLESVAPYDNEPRVEKPNAMFRILTNKKDDQGYSVIILGGIGKTSSNYSDQLVKQYNLQIDGQSFGNNEFNGIFLNDEVYQISWDITSTQPIPKNLDGERDVSISSRAEVISIINEIIKTENKIKVN